MAQFIVAFLTELRLRPSLRLVSLVTAQWPHWINTFSHDNRIEEYKFMLRREALLSVDEEMAADDQKALHLLRAEVNHGMHFGVSHLH